MRTLKKHLERQGLTQAQFAAVIRVSQPTVSSWLAGDKTPTVTHLLRIRDATKIPLDTLLREAIR